MINLPKPSVNRIKGTPDEKINYIVSYLTTLVSSIEQLISGTKGKQKDTAISVKDISVVNRKLLVIYSDGSEKKIDL